MIERRSSDIISAIQTHTQPDPARTQRRPPPDTPPPSGEVDRISSVIRRAAQPSAVHLEPARATSHSSAACWPRLPCLGRRRPSAAPPPLATLSAPQKHVSAQAGLGLVLSALVDDSPARQEEDIEALQRLLERYFLRQTLAQKRLHDILSHAQNIAMRHGLRHTCAVTQALAQGLEPNAPKDVLSCAQALVAARRSELWTYTASPARWHGASNALSAAASRHTAEHISARVRHASATLRRPLQTAARHILNNPDLSYAERLTELETLQHGARWTDDGRRALCRCVAVIRRAAPLDDAAHTQALVRAHDVLRRPQEAFALADQLDTLAQYLDAKPAACIHARVVSTYETLLVRAALNQLPDDMFSGWHAFAQGVTDLVAQAAPEAQSAMAAVLSTSSPALSAAPRARSDERLMAQIKQLIALAPVWAGTRPQAQQSASNALWRTRILHKNGSQPRVHPACPTAAGHTPVPPQSSQPGEMCAASFALGYLFAQMHQKVRDALPLAHLMLGAAFEGVYEGTHRLAARVWPIQVALAAHGWAPAPGAPPTYAAWWTQMQPGPYLTTAHQQAVHLLGTHLKDVRQSLIAP